ncbi:MAG: hypothetical protein IKD31_03345 [Clostridia bacterium]|nr:hypothetical protein [Clostridia bacterium]
MKKIMAVFLALVCLVSLVACQNGENENEGTKGTEGNDTLNPSFTAEGTKGTEGNDILNPYFTGKVVEIYDGGCLLEVTDKGNWNFSIGDRVRVNTKIENCPQYSVDDTLRISFDGVVDKSNPPQIHGVTIVSKTDATGNSIA